MNLTPLKANMTEVRLKDGVSVLYSYETPVALHVTNADGTWAFYKTSKFWSRTTSRHISTWLPIEKAIDKPQEFFDSLCNQVVLR
jgi:hypothetical protein